MAAKKQRIMLKLSGEQFAGSRESGIDPAFINKLAEEIREVTTSTGAQIAIVVGGGNFMRGAKIAGKGIERTTGDYMGMLATIMNGMAMVDLLEQAGQPARLQSRLIVNSVAEPYIRRRAIRHMEKGRVLVVAGGTGNPYVTTDTAAVTAALELNCDMVLKATKVDGVYDKDPTIHKNAKKHSELKHAQALGSSEINVMDNAALSLAMENQLPIVVFDLLTEGNIKRIIQGEKIGTIIS
jgi:uridylate kinase